MTVSNPTNCPRCGGLHSAQARYCQHCGYSLLGPVGAKGAPPAEGTSQQPGGAPGQQPGGQASPPWGNAALGGLAGFLLGSLFGGGRGMFGGWGGGGGWDRDDGGWS